MESIVTNIVINAELNKVHRAITTTEGERGWWTTDCEVGARTGEKATFRFAKEQGASVMEFRIDRLDDDRIEWTCTRVENNPEWLNTKLVFRLAPAGRTTRLDLEHSGWAKKTEMFGACTEGWQYFLNSLKSYMETGKGTPHSAPKTGSCSA